jgi:hypothetical protein
LREPKGVDFVSAEKMMKQGRIRELADSMQGLRYLKLRSLSRRKHLESLYSAAELHKPDKAKAMFRIAFESKKVTAGLIDATIRSIYVTERLERKNREPDLVSELYKLQAFDWGGLHQNSLEKTIVDNYVKKITSYDTLNSRIDNELLASMRGYVLCSWYNHWTSIIIEDVFRDHPNVLPAVGQVKQIDFFLRDVPFDLKVTYLPEGFLKDKRKADKLKPELTLLKRAARSCEIKFDTSLSDSQLLEDLWKKVSDHPAPGSQQLIKDLREYRLDTIGRCQADPQELIRWLYENQGVRRFDASNRLFLVLVDRSDFFASWRLKRAKPLLDQKITAYLDSVSKSPGKRLDFTWESEKYTVISDVVFVIHPGDGAAVAAPSKK